MKTQHDESVRVEGGKQVEGKKEVRRILPQQLLTPTLNTAASKSPTLDDQLPEVPTFSNLSPEAGLVGMSTPKKASENTQLVTPQKIDFVSSMTELHTPSRMMRSLTERIGYRAHGDVRRAEEFMSMLDTPTKEGVIGIESMAESLSSRKRTHESRASTPKRPSAPTPGKAPGTPQSVKHLQWLASSPDWSVGTSSPYTVYSPSPRKSEPQMRSPTFPNRSTQDVVSPMKRTLQPILPKPTTSPCVNPDIRKRLRPRAKKSSPKKLLKIAPKILSPLKLTADALLTKARHFSPDKQHLHARRSAAGGTPASLASSKRRIFTPAIDEAAPNVVSEREIITDESDAEVKVSLPCVCLFRVCSTKF